MTSRLIGRVRFNLEKLVRARRTTLSPADLRALRFFQFRPRTARLFWDTFGKTNITVENTPHYAFALALKSQVTAEIRSAEENYARYLEASWDTKEHPSIPERISAFKTHFAAYRANPQSSGGSPILTSIGKSGTLFVADGNHRVAFAAATESALDCEVWPLSLAFKRFAASSEFYGTGNKGIPYQSIYVGEERVLEGRREDIFERLRMLPTDLLPGASVLDVACNVGMSSMAARLLGARECIGLERSSKMVQTATRFAMLSDVYPAVQFRQFDLDADSLAPNETFDVAFMFSIYAHLRDPAVLSAIAKNHVARAVVFEGHPGQGREMYESFFENFSEVREIGRLRESTSKPVRNRILWLCLHAAS